VEAAVAGLRAALPGLVEPGVGGGYRLAT
jgi:hypothetical protein